MESWNDLFNSALAYVRPHQTVTRAPNTWQILFFCNMVCLACHHGDLSILPKQYQYPALFMSSSSFSFFTYSICVWYCRLQALATLSRIKYACTMVPLFLSIYCLWWSYSLPKWDKVQAHTFFHVAADYRFHPSLLNRPLRHISLNHRAPRPTFFLHCGFSWHNVLLRKWDTEHYEWKAEI